MTVCKVNYNILKTALNCELKLSVKIVVNEIIIVTKITVTVK